MEPSAYQQSHEDVRNYHQSGGPEDQTPRETMTEQLPIETECSIKTDRAKEFPKTQKVSVKNKFPKLCDQFLDAMVQQESPPFKAFKSPG